MSTLFAVIKPNTNVTLRYDEDGDLLITIEGEESFFDEDIHFQFMVSVASRNNQGRIYATNDLAPLLPKELPVWAVDNSPQGIYKIGDIKFE